MKVKRRCQDYVEVDGELYERLTGDTTNVDLELTQDTIDSIDYLVETTGKYVSRGDCIRTALREMMKLSPEELEASLKELSKFSKDLESPEKEKE